MVAGAVALSLALHLVAIGWLGYGLPSVERAEADRTVEVALLAPPAEPEPPPPPPPPKPRPKPRPKPPPAPAQAPPPEAAISTAPAPEPVPHPAERTAEPAMPPEPPAPAPEPVAEPAEPQPVQPIAAARPSMWGVPVRPQPQAARGRYLMHLGDYESSSPVAELDYVLEVGPEGYSMRTSGEAKGLLSLMVRGEFRNHSEGRVGDDGFEPLAYSEQRGDRPERAVKLDRGARLVVFPSGEQAPLPEGLQDRLSLLPQLVLLYRAQPERFVKGGTLAIPLLGSSSVDAALFMVAGTELLSIGEEKVSALRIRRVDPKGKARGELEVWVAEGSDYLPVRVRFTDSKGRTRDQVRAPR